MIDQTPSKKRSFPLHFIDASSRHRAEFARLALSLGHHCEVYSDLSELIAHPPRDGIIVAHDTDADGGAAGILEQLTPIGVWLPLIMFDEHPEPGRIVDAIKAGALEYLALPIEADRLSKTLERIRDEADSFAEARRRMVEARNLISTLSPREGEVLEALVKGGSNKDIARALEISPRTVEVHRSAMMAKLQAGHAAEAVRIKLEARY